MTKSLPSDDCIFEASWLVARGVRHLALLPGSISKTPGEMQNAHTLLAQKGERGAIAFVLPRKNLPVANFGYAAEPWIIEMLIWLEDHEGVVPDRWGHSIYGLLLGYSASEIAEHDARLCAGLPRGESMSKSQIPCNTDKVETCVPQ